MPEVTRVQPWPALIEGPSRAVLLREVGRAMRRGELGATGQLRRLDSGRWEVAVLRLKPAPRPAAWRRPVLVCGGVATTLAGAGGLGWWAVGLVAVNVPAVLGGGAVLLLAWWLVARPRSSGCTITHIRH